MTDLIKRWVAALRSGNYKQGKHQLRITLDMNGNYQYCCLGVLCDLMDSKGWGHKYLDHHGTPSDKILKDVGLDEYFAYTLATKNDKGASFQEISDIIEGQYK